MRLLLDAHISGRVVGRALAEAGHDVRAIDSEKQLEGLPDRGVLELAISEGRRILVTIDVGDFLPLITELNELGRSHAGLICVPSSIRNEEFGVIISGIERALEDTSQEEWIDRVVWAQRSSRRR